MRVLILSLILLVSFDMSFSQVKMYDGYDSKSRINYEVKAACSPYRLYSQNGEYYLESYPYDAWIGYSSSGDNSIGITYVHNAKNDSVLYWINRYFHHKSSFLSNDGLNIVFVFQNINGDLAENEAVRFYYRDSIINTYAANEILNSQCDSYNYRWVFSKYSALNCNFIEEKDSLLIDSLTRNNLYVLDDILYINTIEKNLLVFDINTGRETFEISLLGNIEIVALPEKTIEFFDIPERVKGNKTWKLRSVNDSLYLVNGKLLSEDFINSLDSMVIVEESDTSKFRSYNLRFFGLLNNKGEWEWFSNYYFSHVWIKEAFNNYLENKRFITENPYSIEHWFYGGNIKFKQLDQRKAYQEFRLDSIAKARKIEYRRVADTIDGVYIPKDLTDCMVQLDILVENELKEQLQSNSLDAFSSHFGLGGWLRNNWRLWEESRLTIYFKSHGIDHADDSSVLIIKAYTDWLNNKAVKIEDYL